MRSTSELVAVDLFAGLGGFSTGAVLAGARVAWAANHWKRAVELHEANHPNTIHACQDLHQADFSKVPDHDVMLASPACQGHSRARGGNTDAAADLSRSTAWAVVAAIEVKRPPFVVVENVPDFVRWKLFPAWLSAMNALGYHVEPHEVDSADHGVPQNRERLFLVCSLRAPLRLVLPRREHQPASGFVRLGEGRWSEVHRPGRAAATLARVSWGRQHIGKQFLICYYGNTSTARALTRPIGTITTRDRWAIVDGDRMRMLSAEECKAAMGFPESTKLPQKHAEAVHMLGNAVCPPVAADIITEIARAA